MSKPKASKPKAKNVCQGNGECLEQLDENKYKKFKDYECGHACEPLQCPNYIVCDNIAPQFILDCHGGVCPGCNISIGSLVTKKDKECSVCLKKTLGILRECKKHYFCLDCFKRGWYGHLDNPPEFPYSEEVCEKWERLHRRLDKFLARHPLIEDYDAKYDKWLDEQDIRYRRNVEKRTCQLCQ